MLSVNLITHGYSQTANTSTTSKVYSGRLKEDCFGLLFVKLRLVCICLLFGEMLCQNYCLRSICVTIIEFLVWMCIISLELLFVVCLVVLSKKLQNVDKTCQNVSDTSLYFCIRIIEHFGCCCECISRESWFCLSSEYLMSVLCIYIWT